MTVRPLSRRVILGLLISVCLSGCASIMSGQTQSVIFQSSPPGADVIIDGRTLGKTPMTAAIDRSARSLTFAKSGFDQQTQPLIAVMNPWYWANIPFGGVFIGMAVDGISGAWNLFQPDIYHASLIAENSLAGKIVQEEQKQQAKDFIVNYYKDFRGDVAKGGGRYLSTFWETLEIPVVNRSDALDRLRTLAEFYSDVETFAEQAVNDLTHHSYAFRKSVDRPLSSSSQPRY